MLRLETLADPVRLAVARHLDANPSVTAKEVAEAVGVHLNTARTHLAALQQAGVAERLSESRGRRGRPVVRYRLVEGGAPAGEELLALTKLLAAAVLKSDANPDQLCDLAHQWGRRWASGSGSQPVEDQLVAALVRLGFQAKVRDGRLALSGCPCPLVAPESPELVCGLTDAVIDGVLEGSPLAAASPIHDSQARRCSTTFERGMSHSTNERDP